MSKKVISNTIHSLSEYFRAIEDFVKDVDTNVYSIFFRGESDDFKTGALTPSIYRNELINNEDNIYKEVSRYNNIDFSEDKTTFDKLSRMQHYSAPTRLIDLSDDPLTSLWFAKNGTKECSDACVYIIIIKKQNIKYSDSDTVTVLSNLAKINIENNKTNKSKELVASDTFEVLKNEKSLEDYNNKESVKYLLHEIRNDINHFEPLIEARHISSVICVKPKLTSSRVKVQKGAFLLFGLNLIDYKKSIPIFEFNIETNDLQLYSDNIHSHPIESVLKLKVKFIKKEIIEKIGLIEPTIYPEMDKVSIYFKNKYSK